MRKKRKASNNRKVTFVLLALAVILLLGSAVGSTRAALTYYSENYTAEIKVSQIGVSLTENGKVVSRRDYDGDDWKKESSPLLENMLGEGEKLALNKKYDEKLCVQNTGEIDEYVRVRIYKYWNKAGSEKKINTLSPGLIKLNLTNDGEWVNPDGNTSDANNINKECTVLYHKGPISVGREVEFADTIAIDKAVAAEFTTVDKGNGIVETVYKYDGVEFHVNVEVDAVQTHNAQDAIKSAWGVDATNVDGAGHSIL